MKKICHSMILLLLLFIFSQIESSYDDDFHTVGSLFTYRTNMEEILNFFGQEMDIKITTFLKEQNLTHYKYWTTFKKEYLVPKEYFPIISGQDKQHKFYKHTYHVLKNEIKNLNWNKCEFRGLNYLTYDIHTVDEELYVAGTGILRCEDKYYMMLRKLLIHNVNSRMVSRRPLQYFNVMEVGQNEPFLILDTLEKHRLYIRHSLHWQEKNQSVNFILPKKSTKTNAFRQKNCTCLQYLTGENFIQMKVKDMLPGPIKINTGTMYKDGNEFGDQLYEKDYEQSTMASTIDNCGIYEHHTVQNPYYAMNDHEIYGHHKALTPDYTLQEKGTFIPLFEKFDEEIMKRKHTILFPYCTLREKCDNQLLYKPFIPSFKNFDKEIMRRTKE